MITVERARTLYRYDPETGILYRKHAMREKAGKAKTPNGYLVVTVDGRTYLTHRLIWLIVYGKWPAGNIDHVNRVKTDNRLCNLRDVTQALNMRNNCNSKRTAPVIGPIREGDHWMVILPHYKTTRTIGPFATPDEAHEAFLKQAKWHLPYEGQDEPKLRPPKPRV